MKQKPMENTLLLGNGFSRAIFKDVPSWSGLFADANSSIRNNTMLYENYMLNQRKKGFQEDEIKEQLLQRMKEPFTENGIKNGLIGLERFGQQLKAHHIHNIITTNYDNGIELILCNYCGYTQKLPEKVAVEKIYSVRTHKILYNPETEHRIRLWKIHGDLDRIRSITLGFDHYCGSLARLMSYVKGNYQSSGGPNAAVCNRTIKDKCIEGDFDGMSWVEMFFNTNVYIVGFGMDFSEIDIWWLLNKRARFKLDIPQINNRIMFLYNQTYENPDKDPALFATLGAFGVDAEPIAVDEKYIPNIFEQMTEKQTSVCSV